VAAVTAVAAVMTATIARDADLSVKMSVNAVLNFEFYASPDVGAEGAVHYPVPEVLWRAHLKPV
jgi:hypothetical protein